MQIEIHPSLKKNIDVIKYINCKNIIVKTIYGLCRTNIYNLQNGVFPSIITALDKTNYFKNKLTTLFPDYEKDFKIVGNYKNSSSKILVSDGEHLFNITAKHLISGVKPSMQSSVNKTQYALSIIKKVHGDFYNYDKFEYKGDKGKSIIICPLHGEFTQSFTHHSSGKGCFECGKLKTANFSRHDSEVFINKAIKIHKDKYDYSLVDYKNCKTKVDIICKNHGIFSQIPISHLQGNGCSKCSAEGFKGGYSKNDFIKIANGRPCLLYILKLTNGSEEFYKIGITSLTVNERFTNRSKLLYSYEVIYEYTCDAECVWDLEKEYHRKYKHLQYIPQIHFQGYTECFTLDLPIEEIISYLKSL